EMSDGRYTTTQTTVETNEYYAYDDRPTVQFEMPKFDGGYVRSLGGMLKIICIILCLLCFLCVLIGGPGYYTGAGWATFVTTVGLSITTTLLALYIFHIVDASPQIPWVLIEMIFCFIWTIFFFIAACVLGVAATRYEGTAGWGAASFFALGAMCAYGFDSYLKFLGWKRDEVASGGAHPESRSTAQHV
ncbi:hypothetical protein PENTCL1PPCAC_23984, partial [Pristionchus entomophagus]